MGSATILLCILVCLVALIEIVECAGANTICTTKQISSFKKFKTMHRKKYKDLTRAQLKRDNYCSNDNKINDHNKKEKRWKLAHNHLSDLSPLEFAAMNRAYMEVSNTTTKRTKTVKRATYYTRPVPNVTWPVPDFKNWTALGVTTVVKNQGYCGSCYAFAVVGALEAKLTIETNRTYVLSEQNILDCASNGTVYRNKWCSGGMPTQALHYIADKGLSIASAYPYASEDIPAGTPQNVSCLANATSNGTLFASFTASIGYQWILNPWPTNTIDPCNVFGLYNSPNETLLQQFVAKQPVVVTLYVGSDFMSYSSGVYANPNCTQNYKSNNHAVLIVGYGNDNVTGLDYWLVKNSWGGWPSCTTTTVTQNCTTPPCISTTVTTCKADFGEGGYFRIQRGVNMCGIAFFAAIPSDT